MADDKTTAQEAEALADSSKQAERQLNRLGQSMSKTVNQASKLSTAVNKSERSYKALFKTIFKGTESLEDMEGAVKSTTDKFVEMALKGKQGALGMQVEMRKLAEDTVRLAKKAEDAKGTISNLTSEYKDLQSGMRKIQESIAKLNDQQRKGAITSAYYTKEMAKLNEAQAELDNRANIVERSLEAQGKELYRLNREQVEHHQRSINMIKDMRATEREAMRLKGGFSALKAEMLEYADEKLFSWLDRGKNIERLKKSVQLLGEGYAKVADQYEINRRLDEQYGRTATFGLKGMGDAFMQAEGNAASFAATAFRLRMDIDEVKKIGGEIQARKLGIFGAKDAKEANDNVRMLTDTVASFTRITGVDATTALDALQRRMESTGLSAKDANAELMDMYVTLRQMQGGIENDVVGLDDMVRLIEQASAASDSYVVDSRLMTQAMRAAANEAERLGGSRKLAMKSAEATGKFIGGGGEVSGKSSVATYMATRNLIKDMMVDATPFLKGMNEQQKKYVEGIMAEVRSGKILEHQAAPLIEKAMGGTDEMTKRKFAELQRMYAKSGMKYSLMAEELGMEESEVRVMYQSMEDAIANQKRMQGYLDEYSQEAGKLPLSEFMSKHYENVEDAIKGMKLAGKDEKEIHDLKVKMLREKFKISEKAATEYLKLGGGGGPGGKDDNKTEARKRALLYKAFDPSERAKETAQKLRAMRSSTTDSEKLKKSVTDALMKEYNISTDNAKAVEETNKIAEKIVEGSDDLEEPLKSLAATASKEITTAESHLAATQWTNQLLSKIYDALPGWLQPAAEHARGGGPGMSGVQGMLVGATAIIGLIASKKLASKLLGNSLKNFIPNISEMLPKGLGRGAAKEAAAEGAGQIAKTGAKEVVETTAEQAAKKAAKEGAEKIAESGSKKVAETAAEQAAKSAAKEGAEAAAKGVGKGLIKKLVGPLGLAYEGVSTYMENQEIDARKDLTEAEKSKRKWKNWIKAGGSVVGGALGGIAGSVVGPLGTIAGGVGGSMAGSAGASWLADTLLGEDKEPGAETAATKTEPAKTPYTMEQSKVPEYLKLIADNTGMYASYLKEEQRYRLLKGSLPTAGTFNDAASARLHYTRPEQRTSIRGAVDESRPRLGASEPGTGDYQMDLDPSTYSESEDSVMVKFNNLTSLLAILKKKEATMR